ncbi:hypothetical protein EJ05DRAFT_530501 [Pseudovirgaria hyperparasitica]|uniref:Uncharacterized protein n=1 Tax=Pseudovirgaria hyperparasitica TaxID=470096 RepID=A0A6A6WHK2_9PEZI|nr:uncharacterized protein EJ05DRAFT_530501 [Pseudovirgaria hyperparasitica]KAF2762282.1 hypothetical protein EJ05DRAFT_530501 [Pseudovirgaria hyperparasitica]
MAPRGVYHLLSAMYPRTTPTGHPRGLRSLPRRFQILFGFIAFIITYVILFGTPNRNSIPTVEDLKHPSIPNKLNPFAPIAHKAPPVQANSTRGDSSWFSDWKWHSPFSSTITLDENRALLPPLDDRPIVYTFYDEDTKKSEETLRAENDLLLIWRRAWWAQGFKPVVLGRGEAMQNPLYGAMQRMGIQPELEVEIAKWLAWATMGTGILSNWLALPMAAYDHPELVSLRRGEFLTKITSLDKMQSAIFYGERETIRKTIETIIRKADFKTAKTIMDVLPKDEINVEKSGGAIAYYDGTVLESKYKSVFEDLRKDDKANGLNKLATLINAHLHTTWQNSFSSGIAILKPLPQHTSALVENALDIARNLTQCPLNPLPTSCPPNHRKCTPCTGSGNTIAYHSHYQNKTTLFTIGTVPHPYTLASLHYQQDAITAQTVRRDFKTHDLWLEEVTADLLPAKTSAEARVVRFKEAVAGIHGRHHSLWLTAERERAADLDWLFGFKVPDFPPFDRDRPAAPKGDFAPLSDAEAQAEHALLSKARDVVRSSVHEVVRVRDVLEAWSLADTEAWRFAKAWSARRKVERDVWEQGEKGFAGAEGGRREGWVEEGKKEGKGRWDD